MSHKVPRDVSVRDWLHEQLLLRKEERSDEFLALYPKLMDLARKSADVLSTNIKPQHAANQEELFLLAAVGMDADRKLAQGRRLGTKAGKEKAEAEREQWRHASEDPAIAEMATKKEKARAIFLKVYGKKIVRGVMATRTVERIRKYL